MKRNRAIVKITRIILVCFILAVMLGTLPSIARSSADKFNTGDTVEVCNTLGLGLKVRDAPAGEYIGKEFDGSLGVVLGGPRTATLKGITYTWWEVRYEDGLEGWSAEGYPGGVDYLKQKYVPPSTKFTLGDSVTVTASTLYIRTEPPGLEYKDQVHQGDTGQVVSGPFYGVPKGTSGFYYFWKVDYGSITGWSAEDYLEKVTPCPHSCWDRGPMANDELAKLVRGKFPLGGVTQTGESIRVTAYAIAKAESGGNPSACGDNGKSIGLWQINIDAHPTYDKCRLFEEEYNTNAAKEISNNGEDWNPWCTWEQTACGGNGNESYKQYLTEARKHFYPKVTSLSIPQTLVNLGEAVKIYYSVSDDVGLERVELWRTSDKNGSPDDSSWEEEKRVSISGTDYSDDFNDSPDSPGIYWYGIHVIDNSGAPEAWNCERNSRTGGSPGVHGPIRVTISQPTDRPQVTTKGASNTTSSSATLTGNLDSTGGLDCQVWFEYGEDTSYGSSTTKLSVSSTGPFSTIISELSPDTTYHFRACASNSKGTSYGSDMTFRTELEIPPNNPPTLSWTGEANYSSDGLDPESGSSATNFVYRVKYTDQDGDAPNFVRVHILKGGADITNSPFTMNKVSGTYESGAIYSYSKSGLSDGTDYYYYFKAQDIHGNDASRTSTLDGPDVSIIPYEDWDVSGDGAVNVLDMIRIGQCWGERGPAGWIREDVNKDGTVNVLDMILIGQHWTG